MSKAKRLNLCMEHKQENNQSHFANHNCDHCKALAINDELLVALQSVWGFCRRYMDEAPDVRGVEIADKAHAAIAKATGETS
jgi:hypothetical protein